MSRVPMKPRSGPSVTLELPGKLSLPALTLRSRRPRISPPAPAPVRLPGVLQADSAAARAAGLGSTASSRRISSRLGIRPLFEPNRATASQHVGSSRLGQHNLSTSSRAARDNNNSNSSSARMDTSNDLKTLLNVARLGEVRDFWFEHLTTPEDLILFKQEHGKRWFFGSEELDRICVERFAPTLEAIRASSLRSGGDILEAARPKDPGDWLGLVLLLDQMPRNCYRGDAAAVAFQVFDPMARDVALAAMQRGIPDEEPGVRWRFAYRSWFYLPLMHSEDLAAHQIAEQAYERMRRDVYALLAEGGAGADADANVNADADAAGFRARAAAVVRANGDDARRLVDTQIEFEKKHFDIIKRFGRYPHRNKALGRTSTAEEIEYLDSGGETFSRPPADKDKS